MVYNGETMAAQRQQRQWLALHYAIPVLAGFAITYFLIQLLTGLFPQFHFHAEGYHIHHYSYGIAIMLVTGYVSLWVRSTRVRYACALLHGVASAFVVDETWLWFTLNPNLTYRGHDLAAYVAAFFLLLAFVPAAMQWRKRRR